MKPLLFLAVAVMLLAGCATAHRAAARPMKLVVLGPPNIPIAVSYSADGISQRSTTVMPATIEFTGRSAEWKVQRLSGNHEFRVEFYVGDLRRTSTTSAGHSAIQGAILYESDRERYWAQAVERLR